MTISYSDKDTGAMVSAAIFDMDGTMFDTERLSMEGWFSACHGLGIPLTREQFLLFRGHSVAENEKLFCGWFGPDAPYYEVRSLRDKYINDYISLHGVPIKPGLFELLDALKKLGIRCCIATGTARKAAQTYWDKSGVLPWFDATICGDEVVNCKPDPEIFIKAAEKLGVPPGDCVIFEDSPNGIRAAAAITRHLIVVPDLDEPDDDMRKACCAVCATLADAIKVVKKLAAQ
jgi:HAD superfamily hydrolase (TIGR01509 family)